MGNDPGRPTLYMALSVSLSMGAFDCPDAACANTICAPWIQARNAPSTIAGASLPGHLAAGKGAARHCFSSTVPHGEDQKRSGTALLGPVMPSGVLATEWMPNFRPACADF